MNWLLCSSRIYYVEGNAGWFVVRAPNVRSARREGRKEYRNLRSVRLAVESDVKYYRSVRGYIPEADDLF